MAESPELAAHLAQIRAHCDEVNRNHVSEFWLFLDERDAKAIAEGDALALVNLQRTVRSMLHWQAEDAVPAAVVETPKRRRKRA